GGKHKSRQRYHAILRHEGSCFWKRSAGRNVVRYVRREEAPELKKNIAGYNLFIKLAEQYVDEAIRSTRREREKKKTREEDKIMKF
ncbi:MAG: hypothetical protein L3K26_17760, partial [Candidatus Hydrogenedentes bacterium]|nr:hypothetical protein [Candidatus Hydrogenedentota bacterium]